MAIKKLQNNYTTPEQSKRLLELGVPRYSADCYYGQRKSWIEPQPMIIGDSGTQYKVITRNDIIPCWSVGRLIEIYELLIGCPFTRYNLKISLLDEVLERYAQNIAYMDFSKLED